jgi:5'-3' exonuclease
MSTTELLLIDFSILARPMWEACKNSEERANVGTQIVARVHALALQHPHAAICCDSGKSFRCDLDPTYKAQRQETEAAMRHQFTLAEETLKADGFPVWKVPGFEADDIIATATAKCLAIDGTNVLIASSDKDLLQLVNARVAAKSLAKGWILDETSVREKFKVAPAQMVDYLSLVGDASDNVKGAKGIGGVTAAKILGIFGSLDGVYAAIDKGMTPDLTPAIRASLQEFSDRRETVKALITLRTDVEIPFHEIGTERPVKEITMEEPANDPSIPQTEAEQPSDDPPANPEPSAVPSGAAAPPSAQPVSPVQHDNMIAAMASAKNPQFGLAPAPVEYDKQLEPRNMTEAITLSKHMFDSRMFAAYGTPQAVLSVVLAGRELGLPAMAALRSFHVIEGKPTLAASAIQALVLRSGKAKYFRCTERTPERATFVTKRGDDPEIALTYTTEEARAGWTKDESAWKKSGWGRNPADMNVARAGSKLARLVYPDVVAGLYDPSEME